MATQPRANQIKNTPAGNIAATNVQSALNELDTEKSPLLSPSFTGTPTAPTSSPGTGGNQIATQAYADAAAGVGDTKLDTFVSIRTITSNHTLDSTDLAAVNDGDQYVLQMNSASAISLEIPINATVGFTTGSILGFSQFGVGQLTITFAVGVTLRSANAANKAYAQYSRGYMEKIGIDEWLLSGDLTV